MVPFNSNNMIDGIYIPKPKSIMKKNEYSSIDNLIQNYNYAKEENNKLLFNENEKKFNESISDKYYLELYKNCAEIITKTIRKFLEFKSNSNNIKRKRLKKLYHRLYKNTNYNFINWISKSTGIPVSDLYKSVNDLDYAIDKVQGLIPIEIAMDLITTIIIRKESIMVFNESELIGSGHNHYVFILEKAWNKLSPIMHDISFEEYHIWSESLQIISDIDNSKSIFNTILELTINNG